MYQGSIVVTVVFVAVVSLWSATRTSLQRLQLSIADESEAAFIVRKPLDCCFWNLQDVKLLRLHETATVESKLQEL